MLVGILLKAILENTGADNVTRKLHDWFGIEISELLISLALPVAVAAIMFWLIFEVGRTYERIEAERRIHIVENDLRALQTRIEEGRLHSILAMELPPLLQRVRDRINKDDPMKSQRVDVSMPSNSY